MAKQAAIDDESWGVWEIECPECGKKIVLVGLRVQVAIEGHVCDCGTLINLRAD